MTPPRPGDMAAALARARAEGHRPPPLLDALAVRSSPGADALAVELLDALGSECVSGSDLALMLRRRKSDVLAVLASDSRFVRVGQGRATCWQARGTGREPNSGHASLDPDREHPPTSTERLIGSEEVAA